MILLFLGYCSYGYLTAHNTKTVSEVENMAACIQLCQNENEFRCISLDFSKNTCYLQKESRYTDPGDYVTRREYTSVHCVMPGNKYLKGNL